MNFSLFLAISRYWLLRIDGKIRVTLDRILPRNLTIRYIAALSAIGILSLLGQVVVQMSLSQLESDQKKITAIEFKLHDNENLRKAASSLQLNTGRSRMINQVEGMLRWLERLEINRRYLESSDAPVQIQYDAPSSLPELAIKEKRAILGIILNFRFLRTLLADRSLLPGMTTASQIGVITQDLLNNVVLYEHTLKALAKFYEMRLIRRTSESHQLELFFLFATLFLLGIEGLYVYRPAVESLYEALRTRSDFLGRMGHEIRNPMNSIIGMANLLSETNLTDQQRKYVSTLRKSSGSLLEMLNNLLDFSSVDSNRIKLEKIPFNLYELVEKTIELAVFGAHAHGIELILDIGTDVPLRLMGDPTRLQQVLSNLLGNAVKFTKVGEVTLQVSLVKGMGDPLIHFSIIDTGMGIDQKKIQQIFDPFVQEDSSVRRKFGGSGLGLSIANELVKLMGGRLEVESEKNVGSRFFFTLPLAMDPRIAQNESINQVIQAQKAQGQSPEKFDGELDDEFDALILEPNPRISFILESLVKKMGGNVSSVTEQTAVAELFSKRENSPSKGGSLFICDYDFVKGPLHALFSRARKDQVDFSRFIFLVKTTASAGELEKLADDGAKSFLFKPVKPNQLIELISSALTGKKDQKILPLSEELVQDGRALRVLAADDSKDNQFLIKAYLESLPYRIVFADNGLIALQKFKEGRFDVVLMDLQMPEMDGYSAVEAIRKWEKAEGLSAVPIIAVTAHDHEYESTRFQNAGFSGYLIKPISPNQLRKAILKLTPDIRTVPSSTIHVDATLDMERQIAELVPGYLMSRREDMVAIRTLIEKADFKRIAVLGHRIKGSAKSYGFEELGKLGACLEDAAEGMSVEKTLATVVAMEEFLLTAH